MLDHQKLVTFVSNCPALWNKKDEKYFDEEFKMSLWNNIGKEMNTTGIICQESFKSLLHNYINRKERTNLNNWELHSLTEFLDLQIMQQKDCNKSVVLKSDPYIINEDYEEGPSSESETGSYISHDSSNNSLDYSKTLIQLVHQSPALWDRCNRDHHDKITKNQLWKNIAKTLKTDANSCILRWKGLREKYIRQKQKYNEGLGKWELLDDLTFLDGVILYRKRHWRSEENSALGINENSSTPSHPNSDCESPALASFCNNSIYPFNYVPNQQGSSNLFNRPTAPPDSTFETTSSRLEETKRQCFDNDAFSQNNSKNENHTEKMKETRNPEQIFGELVVAMLTSKPEKEKHAAMMEIMSILARPSNT